MATRRTHTPPAPDQAGDNLTRISGVGPVATAIILAHTGDIRRFPTEDEYASYNGTAPIEASSGPRRRHRLNPRGNRQLNHAMHIIASVFINDDERGLHHDFEVWLEALAPHEPVKNYHHNRTGEDNADAHLKRQIMGREVVVAITKGKLDFGPWEQIFYGEFDGRRPKRALVKI